MNEDWMTELEPRAGEALERQLDRFVRVRLEPSPAQVKRARSAVMEAAWRQRLNAPASSSEEPSVAAAMLVLPSPFRAGGRSRGLFGSWSSRRLGASFAAAILAGLMLGTSVFASSRAGGPLYEARLAVEALTLPFDRQARVEAEIAQAEARLAEIVDASARHDDGAVAAAVKGYLASLDDLDEAVGGPADRALIAIKSHRDVLLRVLGEVPEQAQGGVQNALARSSMVIERLDAAATPAVGPTGGTSGPGGNGGAPGAGNGGAAAGAGAGAGAGDPGANNGGAGSSDGSAGASTGGTNPTSTPGAGDGNGDKPDPTPKVARTPKPARTPIPTPDRPDRATPDRDTGPRGGKP
jgi:hypothetical protein